MREEPYLLEYNDIVSAQVRAYNYNGWSEYSGKNLDGSRIQTEPAKMNTPQRGAFTSYTQIHVEWQEQSGDETGGSPIVSYYLQWDAGTAEAEWHDLVGLTSPNLATSFIVSTGVEQGELYKFRLKSENAHGFSAEWSDLGSIYADDKPD